MRALAGELSTAVADCAQRTAPMASIVMPVFNGERYLKESLDSVLAQTYTNFEVIVMDDSSTDGSWEVIQSYGDRVRGFHQPTNRGIYANTNDGIQMANGEYIAFYHADDVYEPDILAKEIAVLQRDPALGAVFTRDLFIDPSSRVYGQLRLPPDLSGSRALDYADVVNALLKYKNTFLRCPSCVARSSVYQDVGLYRQDLFKNTSDLDMWLRISRKYQMVVLDECLFRYRHGIGNSGQRYRYLRTDSERFFTIMDVHLNEGARHVATTAALSAYEGHRAQDNLMRAISYYILGQLDQSRAVLRGVSARQILGGTTIRRQQMLFLFCALQLLVRLPRSAQLGRAMYRRWHARFAPPATVASVRI
jgi:GT2 family glycosyltransferase